MSSRFQLRDFELFILPFIHLSIVWIR